MKTLAKIAKTRGSIPSLNNICINGGKAVATDIDTFIIKSGVDGLKDGVYHAINFDKKPIENNDGMFNPDHWPELPTLEKSEILDVMSLNRDQIAMLEWVFAGASSEEIRYYLNGVCFDATNGAAVATDGHRLHKMDISLTVAHPDYHMGYIVPSDVMEYVFAAAREEKTAIAMEVIFYRSRVSFRIGDYLVIGKYVDGTFPDWVRVIPSIEMNGKSELNAAAQKFKAKDLKDVISEAKIHAKIHGSRWPAFSFCNDSTFKIFYPGMAGDLHIKSPYTPPIDAKFTAAFLTSAPDGDLYFNKTDRGPLRIDGAKFGQIYVCMPVSRGQ